MTEWVSDLRHTFRLLAATPGFTGTAIVSLALGIGLNTAVLAVARAALLAPLPVEAPQNLSIAYWSAAGERRNVVQLNSSGTRDERTGKDLTSNFTYPAYAELRQIAGAGADVFAFTFLREASISLDGHAMVGGGMLVSGNYFSGLGVPMAVGRRLSEEDDREQAEPAAVIGYTPWQRAFGGDPSAVGRTIKVNGRPFTLVGVTAPRFFGVSNGGFFPPADVTLPLRAQPAVSPRWTEQWGSLFATDQVWWLRIMVRMRPGGEPRQIQEALNLRFAQHLATTRSEIKSPEIVVLPGARGLQSVRNAVEKPIYILGGVSALVFLIACINVAGLVLALGSIRWSCCAATNG
jgi:ABC-type antimicrobial peptide transport system permease subunit